MKRSFWLSFCFVLLHTPFGFAQEIPAAEREVDSYSFRLSSAVSPEDMAELDAGLRAVAAEQGALTTLEPELIVTDLLPADIARGKHVMLIHKHPSTLEKYETLKKDQAALVESGKYSGEARKDIARRFGRLLSYPDSTIEEKIRSNGTSP